MADQMTPAGLLGKGHQNLYSAIEQRWRDYDGDRPTESRLRQAVGDPDDNLPVNYLGMIVDKGATSLFGTDDLSVRVDPQGGEPRPDDDDYLDAFWNQTDLLRLATNGGVAGHAWAKISPPRLPGGVARFVVLDPTTCVHPVVHPDDRDVVDEYRITWPSQVVIGGRTRQVIRRQRHTAVRPEPAGAVDLPPATGWTITDEFTASTAGSAPTWNVLNVEQWPYPWPSVVECQNLPARSWWGKSDLTRDVVTLNYGFDRVVSNMNRIIRLYAHPTAFGRGMGGAKVRIRAGEAITVPSEKADLRFLEMQSDLQSSLALLDRLYDALHETSRVPAAAAGKLESTGQLSGVALRILYGPILEKTGVKRLTYGALLRESSRRALALAGGEYVQAISIPWPELLPSDPEAERRTALADRDLGVSQQTLLDRLGYDAAAEAELRADEQQGPSPADAGDPTDPPA